MKKIMWENWNEKEIELADGSPLDNLVLDSLEGEEDQTMQMDSLMSPFLSEMQSPVLHTPFGAVPSDSILKPSDRWQCWLGYTNFDDRIKRNHFWKPFWEKATGGDKNSHSLNKKDLEIENLKETKINLWKTI